MSKDSGYVSTEQETMQQMCQAMAEWMQSDGMNISAAEIEQIIDEQQSNTPPLSSENEEQVLTKMAEHQAVHQVQNPEYVVQGAMVKCQFGSCCGQLNLPLCHGVYAMKKPILFQSDCMVGMNIPTFGTCTSPANPANAIGLGAPCVPIIVQTWDDTHDHTRIGKEGQAALTTRSFLVCQYKGLIQILSSGQ